MLMEVAMAVYWPVFVAKQHTWRSRAGRVQPSAPWPVAPFLLRILYVCPRGSPDIANTNELQPQRGWCADRIHRHQLQLCFPGLGVFSHVLPGAARGALQLIGHDLDLDDESARQVQLRRRSIH